MPSIGSSMSNRSTTTTNAGYTRASNRLLNLTIPKGLHQSPFRFCQSWYFYQIADTPLSLFVICFAFYPRDDMCKRGICCRKASVRPSVHPTLQLEIRLDRKYFLPLSVRCSVTGPCRLPGPHTFFIILRATNYGSHIRRSLAVAVVR